MSLLVNKRLRNNRVFINYIFSQTCLLIGRSGQHAAPLVGWDFSLAPVTVATMTLTIV